MTTPLERLSDFLDHEEKWTKGAYARNSYDAEAAVDGRDACRWCLVGAYSKIGGVPLARDPLLHRAAQELFGERGAGITRINDHRETTFADIRRIIDRAIELERAERGKQ